MHNNVYRKEDFIYKEIIICLKTKKTIGQDTVFCISICLLGFGKTSLSKMNGANTPRLLTSYSIYAQCADFLKYLKGLEV